MVRDIKNKLWIIKTKWRCFGDICWMLSFGSQVRYCFWGDSIPSSSGLIIMTMVTESQMHLYARPAYPVIEGPRPPRTVHVSPLDICSLTMKTLTKCSIWKTPKHIPLWEFRSLLLSCSVICALFFLFVNIYCM